MFGRSAYVELFALAVHNSRETSTSAAPCLVSAVVVLRFAQTPAFPTLYSVYFLRLASVCVVLVYLPTAFAALHARKTLALHVRDVSVFVTSSALQTV